MSTPSFEERYRDLLDTLDPVNRRAVIRSVTSAILDGWEPTREQVERQVRAAREGWDVDRLLAELGHPRK